MTTALPRGSLSSGGDLPVPRRTRKIRIEKKNPAKSRGRDAYTRLVGIPLGKYWSLLSRHARSQRRRFALLAAFLLGSIALRVLAPRIMRSFIDAAGAGEALRVLVLMASGFIGVALLQQALSVALAFLGESVSWTATNSLREELAARALSLDMSWDADHAPGEMIERIDGDASELSSFFSQLAMSLTSNALLLAGILVAVFLEDWRAGLAFAAFSALSILALGKLRNIAVADQKARREAQTALFGFVEEQLAGTEDIRSCGAEPWSIRELYRRQRELLVHHRRADFKRFVIDNSMGLAMTVGVLLAFATGFLLHRAGAITVGTAYLFVQYVNMIEEPLWEMTRQIESLQTIGACVDRLGDFLALRPAISDGCRDFAAGRPLALSFEEVGFSYDGGEAVIDGLSFELRPGVALGVLGRTGSGKTTLARLAARLYDPRSGRVAANGVDLRELRVADLRREIALVTQDVQLFRASVRDNLAFFDPGLPDARMLEALEALELGDWLRSLPEGLDSTLEAGGRCVSAGEAQLLAFARVLLRDPGLVILDEASSRLDPATELRLERAIDTLLSGRSAIVIAHRLATVERADEILILEGGRAVERGGREELAADPLSRFSALRAAGLEEALA